MFGVRQGSILGRLLLIVFLCDILFILNYSDVASYTDYKTGYATAETIDEVKESLKRDSVMLLAF